MIPHRNTKNIIVLLRLVEWPEVGIEGFNGAVYMPTANQPGFIAGFNVTYHVLSDTPEPGSVALFVSMGLSGTAFLARRRKRARKDA